MGMRSRARLWMAWSGARAKMLSSSVSYADHLRSASAVLRGASDAARRLKQHEHQIDLDLERTFPNHAAFRRFRNDHVSPDRARGGPCASASADATDPSTRLKKSDETAKPSRDEEDASRLGGSKLEPLRRVLLALAHAVPDVGYTQGMNFVCGWCLLVLDEDKGLKGLEGLKGVGSRTDEEAAAKRRGAFSSEERAFWLMRAVLEDVLPGYFDPGLAALCFDLDALDDEFLAVAPDAHAALENLGCQLRCFTPRWLLCVMVGTAPAAATLRVWDALLLETPVSSGGEHFRKSLRFRPRDVLRRCALAMLTEPGRARAIAIAPGAAEAVESIRAAGRGVADLQAFLRRVRDLAPGARPAGLRAARGGSTAAALATADPGAAAKPISVRLGPARNPSRNPARRNAAEATSAEAATPPRATFLTATTDAAPAPPALTPFGVLLSAMRGAPAGEPAKPRALRWGRDSRLGGGGGDGEGWKDGVAGRGSKRLLLRGASRSGRENQNGVEMDGGCGATPSRRRVVGVDAMASWASPPSLRSPIRPDAGYAHEPPLATRSPLARMR